MWGDCKEERATQEKRTPNLLRGEAEDPLGQTEEMRRRQDRKKPAMNARMENGNAPGIS
jgi:hypothetical protein